MVTQFELCCKATASPQVLSERYGRETLGDDLTRSAPGYLLRETFGAESSRPRTQGGLAAIAIWAQFGCSGRNPAMGWSVGKGSTYFT